MKATKMFRQSLLATVLLASLASTAANAASWTTTVTVTAIQMSSGGNIWIQISGAWPQNGACTSYTWGVLQSTAANFNLLATTLYDAYMNGDPITVGVSGCSTYPIIAATQVGGTTH